MTRIGEVLDAISGMRLCIVGDLLLDVYEWGRVDRISPEAPVPVVVQQDVTYRASGVATAAQAVVELCQHVQVITATGDDSEGGAAVTLLEQEGASVQRTTVPGRMTPRKTRIIASGQQLLRLDRETVTDLDGEHEQQVIASAQAAVASADAVLISDYAKGVCTAAVARAVIDAARAHGLPVVVDPKRASPGFYGRATAITPNLREFGELAKGLGSTDDSVVCTAAHLRTEGCYDWVVVTRSEDGMLVVGSEAPFELPTYADAIADVSGAGDAAAASLALALGAGATIEAAARMASVVAALSMRHLEHKRVTAADLRAAAAQLNL